ncbi:MAG: hypothetical protein EBS21_06105 [Sphingomonadaceae bacterium]|nr:hypothetical protein [Sphingomonadaceae bacterium]
MKSWKTTLGGILVAAGQLLAPSLPPNYTWVSATLTGLGGLILGVSARDNKVSTAEARSK